jgi:UDP-GlcNAc:undecaprenyl-phosphate GlcNAc-1-phosphate transferase
MLKISVFALSFLIAYVISKFFAEKKGIPAFYGIFPREISPFHKDKKEILKVGGLIIFISVVFTLFTAFIFTDGLKFGIYDLRKAAGLVAGSIIILLLGIFDDTRKFNYKLKFLWQLAATVPILVSGYKISAVSFFGQSLEIYATGYFLMIFWLILITNAINLIDGLDGLASGVGIITFSALAIISHKFYPNVAILCLACIGSLLAFLRYNLYPAKLFLGDNGSLLLGFVLAVLSLETSLKMNTLTALGLPILILIVPIGSAFYSFIRRLIRGKDPFVADRLHLHHLLLRSGIPHQVVVMLFWFSTMILAMLGVVSYFLDRRLEFFILAAGVLLLIVAYILAITTISRKK